MLNFDLKKVKQLKKFFTQEVKEPAPLIKNQPVSLEKKYTLQTIELETDQAFAKLRARLFTKIGNKMYREFGKLPGRRKYFYIQPHGLDGLLFETTVSGWLVSKAHKIHANESFQREYETFDRVELFTTQEDRSSVRLNSQRFQGKLVSLSFYEYQLLKSLGIEID